MSPQSSILTDYRRHLSVPSVPAIALMTSAGKIRLALQSHPLIAIECSDVAVPSEDKVMTRRSIDRVILAIAVAVAMGTAIPAIAQVPRIPTDLSFSPWTKICPPARPGLQKACLITTDGRMKGDAPIIVVQLVLPEAQPATLRFTLPLGMRLREGITVSMDSGKQMHEQFETCLPLGCIASLPADDETISALKTKQAISIRAVDGRGAPLTFRVLLDGFSKAFDGPPMDEKAFEQQQRGLIEHQKRQPGPR